MINCFETYLYACFYCQTTPILKTLGQFENLVFVIMSTIGKIYALSLELLDPVRDLPSMELAKVARLARLWDWPRL